MFRQGQGNPFTHKTSIQILLAAFHTITVIFLGECASFSRSANRVRRSDEFIPFGD